MTDRRIYSGAIYCFNPDWKLVYEKEAGEVLSLNLSGTWRPNKYWGDVDYRGKINSSAPQTYRGPGKPEGCMLVRTPDGMVHALDGLPFVIAPDVAGTLYLACNDDPAGLGDNTGQIAFELTSDLV